MDPECVAVLFNPSSGKGRALRMKSRVERSLKKYGIPYDFFVTQSEEDLRYLTRRLGTRYATLVGAGGDSTLALMAHELLGGQRDVSLGFVSLGSSNDIAREFGLESLEEAYRALKKKITRRIDVGLVVGNNQNLFTFLGQANVGLGFFVNRYVQEAWRRFPILGRHQALAGTLGVVSAFRQKKIPLALRVRWEGGEMADEFVAAVFSNVRYWATGKIISPSARPDDGKLDACLIRRCSLSTLMGIYSRTKKGKHVRLKEVTTLRSSWFDISSPSPFSVQADGEIVGGSDPPARFTEIRVQCVPGAIRFIGPAD